MPHDLTLAVHAGENRDAGGGPLVAPLVDSAAFAFDDAADAAARFAGDAMGDIYGRRGNPTVRALEAKVAALEGSEAAVALSSGMAAVHAALTVGLSSGDHIVAAHAIYGETARLLRERLSRFGVAMSFVDATLPAQVSAAVREHTRSILIETPANPNLAIVDVAAIADIAHEAGARLVVDGTFATPWHQKPLQLGADLVVHSATKALGGHGDALGGVVAGTRDAIEDIRHESVRTLGAALAPAAARLISRGLQTMGLRMHQASTSAATLAEKLRSDPRVQRVYYPGLASHPGHAIAARQMKRGFGAMLAFDVGDLDAGRRAYDALRLIARAVSLGDVRSSITHPASTTHASMPLDQRRAAGIGDGLMRLSVGIEDAHDIWTDLNDALGS